MKIKAKKTNCVSENAIETSSLVLKFRRLIHLLLIALVVKHIYCRSKAGAQKGDTHALPRPSAQDLAEALTKMTTTNLIIFVADIPVRLRNVATINLPFLEVMIIDTLPFCLADIAEYLETK